MTAPTGQATPQPIVDIATGYMAAKQLFAANRVGLFRALSDGPRDAAELARATGVSERASRILADAMNSLGLLERGHGNYSLTTDTAEYLDGTGEVDLQPFLTFLGEISYPHWLQFDTTVDTDKPGELDMTGNRSATFMSGVMRYNALHAQMLAREFDFTGYRNMLDLGGLSPDFAIGAMRANTELSVRFVYAPEFTEGVTTSLAESGLSERARVEPAATESARPGGSHDIVMANHVLHRFTPEQNHEILANARASATDGATLLLLDFVLDDDERQRPIDALHAGEYLVIDGTVVYRAAEIAEWLAATGWQQRATLNLPGSPRVIVAEAV